MGLIEVALIRLLQSLGRHFSHVPVKYGDREKGRKNDTLETFEGKGQRAKVEEVQHIEAKQLREYGKRAISQPVCDERTQIMYCSL